MFDVRETLTGGCCVVFLQIALLDSPFLLDSAQLDVTDGGNESLHILVLCWSHLCPVPRYWK